MGKRIRRSLMAALLAVFLGSTAVILYVQRQYRASEELYRRAAMRYTFAAPEYEGEDAGPGLPPVQVDFDALLEENADAAGWIYCEDTPLDYVVVQGADNDYYLKHSYDGAYSASGTVFVDAGNRPGFADCNTVVYGHNMKNGSMFACLSRWADQEFYEAHPVIWLLTPQQDYQIVLLGGCTTSAHADVYTIYPEACGEFDGYVEQMLERSDFRPLPRPEGTGRYVLLSTCAYVFEDARYILFGELVPVGSAGGRQIMEGEDQGRGS